MPPSVPEASFGEREAMPLDSYLAEVGNVDDVLKGLFPAPNNDDFEELAEKQKRTAACYARLFASDDGRAVLEDLADNSVRRPTFFAQLGLDAMQMAMLGCQREGSNALFFFIMRMIALGRQQMPPQREGS